MDEKNKIMIVEDEEDKRFVLNRLQTKNNYKEKRSKERRVGKNSTQSRCA